MSIAVAKKLEVLSQAADPRMAIIKAVGDLDDVTVFSDMVLVGTFIRHEKTSGGIILTKDNIAEDIWQGKVGLVLKAGPLAYADWETDDQKGKAAQIGTWIVYAIKDGWGITLNEVPCRLIPYDKIRMSVVDPKKVF